MPGSRALKSIANGLVETFMSRNNDVFGYWGIGQIQRELEGYPDMVVELDLLHEKAAPDGQIARELAMHYSVYLFKSLARDGFASSAVTTAKVLVEFDTVRTPGTAVGFTWRAFDCKVVLASRSGRVFSAARAGSSHAHDPGHEHRSKRAE
jgi:hypothetical protein